MADNVTADPGTGGAEFQTALLTWSGDSVNSQGGFQGILTGSEGSWTFSAVLGGAGAVAAGVQRTTLASNDPAVVSLAVIDDWDESDRAKANIIVGQAGIAAGAGAVGVTVPRVTLASDDPAVALLTTIDVDTSALAGAVSGSEMQVDVVAALPVGANVIGQVTANAGTNLNTSSLVTSSNFTNVFGSNTVVVTNGGSLSAGGLMLAGTDGGVARHLSVDASGQLQVDVAGALPAGTNAIGKLAANSGVDIGDVDILSIAAGDNNIGNVDIVTVPAPLSTTGGGTEAAALRVTVASDSTGVLSVDDNGGALTVDNGGTFATQATVQAATSGGVSFFKSIDLDESEEEVKGTAGQLYGGIVMNMKATPLYLKIYNATAANVTVGTTVPDMTIPIPSPGDTTGAGFTIPIPAQGIAFGTAITVACTTGVADNDAGAPGANECIVALWYK